MELTAKKLGDRPAFARPGTGSGDLSESGMTTRVYIATELLAGILANGELSKLKLDQFAYARSAVIDADALLAELAKGPKP